MRALTLWQPWAHAVAHLGKRVENRPWAAPASVLGERVALHAGLKFDAEAFGHLKDELEIPEGVWIPQGAVVGVFVVERNVISRDAISEDQRRWWAGPYAWLLRDVVAVGPFPCRGYQGFWTLPPNVSDQVHVDLGLMG